ncbi:DUF2304 domain-containing protein [Cellulomonas chengniuliangii]|uniref:DUF2304 domain-containing protein n=1 Tax=Cellulomonas chengniuliangii TaxID=2968084 RepID=A0ABY5L1L8_9CELL|nr:DUF2304 domain-containing protein [Cellulomonas chengniuliangii]MCC2308736.1 DUF2304 domain-containing protein [Cellulomonas chengniuliangii]UUI74513.1 DUF2304 domain-containing protein [Cellulomonas chengniuliangii]
MSPYATVLVVCGLVVLSLLYLLRTRKIKEKYAAIWIALAAAILILGAVPSVAFWLSGLVGVQTPANLIFAVAVVVLFAVCIQLSTEVTHLEEETRTLAEEVALLRLEVTQGRESDARTAERAESSPR